jgi:hypothetical protein
MSDIQMTNRSTVKPVYNDHHRDPKFETVIDKWSLFRGSFIKIERQNFGRCRKVVVNYGLTTQ